MSYIQKYLMRKLELASEADVSQPILNLYLVAFFKHFCACLRSLDAKSYLELHLHACPLSLDNKSDVTLAIEQILLTLVVPSSQDFVE